MGMIVNNTYKNTFNIDEENHSLSVLIESKKLCRELFEILSKKESIININIISGCLSQSDFNSIIDVIRLCTDKPTDFSFFPELKENENETDAYQRYISDYRRIDDDSTRHFPDNIFINKSIVELDDQEDNLVKYNIKKRSII